jgi:hypothetical protein
VLKKPPQARVLEFKFEVAFTHFRKTSEFGHLYRQAGSGAIFPRAHGPLLSCVNENSLLPDGGSP